jgi:hypothetical protein
MCGRVAQKTPLGEIRALFETTNPVPNTGSTPGRIAWVHASRGRGMPGAARLSAYHAA